jgi:hypothetical protein
MKKIILSISILSGFLIVSCDKNEISQDANSNTINSNELQKQSSIISGVESMYINGLGNAGCANNILIFPTWNKYYATIDQLDQMIENECNAFDATVPNNTSDDQYDALALAAGFDEDNVLIKFEKDLDFCSLRRKIETLENAWLDLQGDGVWNANADPDNHFIDDDTERALLSYNAEVIIGDKKRGYVYYKFLDDVGNWIEVKNFDLNAISLVSQGSIPSNNPNVVISKPPLASSYSCKEKVKEVSYVVSGDDRLKRISKVRPAFGTNCNNNPCTSVQPSKVKAKTQGYKKKNGKWKRRRLWIAAGINGQTQQASGLRYIDCVSQNELLQHKEKRRRKVKVKATTTTYIPIVGVPQRYNNALQDNKLYSYHKRGNLIVNKDFYDMPEN